MDDKFLLFIMYRLSLGTQEHLLPSPPTLILKIFHWSKRDIMLGLKSLLLKRKADVQAGAHILLVVPDRRLDGFLVVQYPGELHV